MKKYYGVCDFKKDGDAFFYQCKTADEAIRKAQNDWDGLSRYDKKRSEIVAIEYDQEEVERIYNTFADVEDAEYFLYQLNGYKSDYMPDNYDDLWEGGAE